MGIGGFIAIVLFGLIVGAVARMVVPGKQKLGWILTSFLGIVGSLAGGGISWLVRGGEPDMYQPAGWIMSIIGAVLLIVLGRKLSDRT